MNWIKFWRVSFESSEEDEQSSSSAWLGSPWSHSLPSVALMVNSELEYVPERLICSFLFDSDRNGQEEEHEVVSSSFSVWLVGWLALGWLVWIGSSFLTFPATFANNVAGRKIHVSFH